MEPEIVIYPIVPERSHDGSWWAVAPDLPGLLIHGASRRELIASAPDAIAQYVAAMRDDACPIPEPGSYAVERTASQQAPVPITVSIG